MPWSWKPPLRPLRNLCVLSGKRNPAKRAKDTQSPQSETPPYLSTDPEIILKNQKEQCYVDIGAFENPTKPPYFHSNQ